MNLSRLQADADACLAFLIRGQEDWQPLRRVADSRGQTISVRTTLVAVSPAELLLDHRVNTC